MIRSPNEDAKNVSTSSRPAVIVMKIALFVIFFSFMFVAAGTVYWPEAWLFFGFYFAAVVALMIRLKKNNPGLLRERMSVQKDVKSWDKIIIRVYSGLLIFMLLIVPLDAVRFRWSHVPVLIKAFAFLVIFLCVLLIFWVFRENAYLSQFVRIQADRGQKVCTTGPYKFIRHPMYVGVILIALCLPLFLGSFFGLLPASLIAALFFVRTSLEDTTLRNELPGYQEYADRVRSKLTPKIW